MVTVAGLKVLLGRTCTVTPPGGSSGPAVAVYERGELSAPATSAVATWFPSSGPRVQTALAMPRSSLAWALLMEPPCAADQLTLTPSSGSPSRVIYTRSGLPRG